MQKRCCHLVVVCGVAMSYLGDSGLLLAKTKPSSTVRISAQPRELGQIAWLRDFDKALVTAKKENKPILLLFQEVPGCHTCTQYGDDVLSHPLVVDAAQTLFVSVAIFNNLKGDDERVLKSFKEPSWNNPVVRVIAHDRTPLAARVNEEYTLAGISSAMVTGLEKLNRSVPSYLRLLAEESAAHQQGLEQAVFEMHCFWEGESALAEVDGVVGTLAGFVRDKEVVQVTFDPKKTGYAALLKKAKRLNCARQVFTRNDAQQSQASALVGEDAIRTDESVRPDKDPKYYLAQTAYKYLPMTELQALRINRAIHRKQNPGQYLSPSQVRLLSTIEKNEQAQWPIAIGATNITQAWASAQAVAKTCTEK